MNILILCSRDAKVGGVAEFLHFLPPSLKKLGINTYLYTKGDGQTSTLPNGLEQFTGPILKPSFFTSRKKLQPLIDLCIAKKIDLIHAQGTYRSGYMAMKAAQKLGIPYVVTSHSDIVSSISSRMKRGSAQRRCMKILKNATAVTHLTPLMADFSHQIYNTEHKSFLVHNGIDLNFFKPGIEKDYVLAIGRLEHEKGFHVLINAFNILQQKGVRTKLVIAGTGAYENALKEQVKTLGLTHITFPGYVRNEHKTQLISESQLFLFPTQPAKWEEPFGIAMLEGMASGKAIIASDMYVTRYLKKLGAELTLVKAEDSEAWAAAILELLQNKDQRENFGALNRKNAENYTWDIIAKEYKKVYEFVTQ